MDEHQDAMQYLPISKVSEVVSGDDVDLRNGALVHQSLGGFRGRRVPDNDDLEGVPDLLQFDQ